VSCLYLQLGVVGKGEVCHVWKPVGTWRKGCTINFGREAQLWGRAMNPPLSPNGMEWIQDWVRKHTVWAIGEQLNCPLRFFFSFIFKYCFSHGFSSEILLLGVSDRIRLDIISIWIRRFSTVDSATSVGIINLLRA
jgi:hypothetical protein